MSYLPNNGLKIGDNLPVGDDSFARFINPENTLLAKNVEKTTWKYNHNRRFHDFDRKNSSSGAVTCK
jgi:hypothetical protein